MCLLHRYPTPDQIPKSLVTGTTKASRNGEGNAKYRGGIYSVWRKSMLFQMQKDKLGKASTGPEEFNV